MKYSFFSGGVALAMAAAALPGCKRDRDISVQDPVLEKSADTVPIATQAPSLRGEDITRAVRSELQSEAGVSLKGIRVGFNAGVIELTGTTANLLHKERAAKLAQAVRGVIAVSNRVEVRPPPVKDDQLRAHIESALVFNPTTDSLEVSVKAKEGVATLNGMVDSWVEKDTAELVAKGVRGVREVKNELAVVLVGKRDDAEIERDVESRLRWDALVNHGLIDVEVQGGVVTLTGYVGSAAERDRAYRLSGWIMGTKAVETDDLAVRWWAKDEDLKGPAAAKPSDLEIRDAIKAAALVDPRVKSYAVEPIVSGGFVTLQGRVDNPRAKVVAEALSRNTVGVIDVKNEMVVASKPVADSSLQDRIVSALAFDPIAEAYQVKVKVKGGVVTLTGNVDSHFESARAEDVAMGMRGVKDVENELQVEHPEHPYVLNPYLDPYDPMVGVWRYVPRTTTRDDREIHEDIVEEITWSPFVDADQVSVRVVNGKATLTGSVDSYSEARAASENAFEGGALVVENHLKVLGG